MKNQNTNKQYKLNEKYNKKINIELNNNTNTATLKTARTSINSVNLNNKNMTEISDNSNNINNINNVQRFSLKTESDTLFLEKEKNIKNSHDKCLKKIPYNNKNKNEMLLSMKSDALTYIDNKNHSSKCRNNIYSETYTNININNNPCFHMNNISFKQSLNTPSNKAKNENNEKRIKYIKKITYNSKKKSRMKESNEKDEIEKTDNLGNLGNIYEYDNKTSNEIDYKKMDSNTKKNKGTFSFATFIKKNSDDIKNVEYFGDDELDDKENINLNIFEEKTKKNKSLKAFKSINNSCNKVNNTLRNVKRNNNIILLNFRSDKRRFTKEKRLSTSSEKEISENKNGAIKIIELLKNKRNEKIMLKEKETTEIEKNKEENIKSDENKENDINAINIKEVKRNISKEYIKKEEVDMKKNNEDDICNVEKDEKKYKDKNIFNNIIEEVKQEKNYIQKVVHRKLIEGIKELKNDNNNYERNPLKYNTRTYKELNGRTNIDYINKNYNYNEEQIDDISYNRNRNNICSNFLSMDKNNKRFLKINIDKIRNRKRHYEKNRTYNINHNIDSNDFTYLNNDDKNKNENNSREKIKKIKLDKLKNKIQKNKLNNNGDENKTNINLKVNNKMRNIYDSQKIYMPKKVPKAKRPSLDVVSIPIFNSHSPDYKNNNLLFPSTSTYNKNEEIISSTYMNNNNNIKPELATFNLDNNENNNASNTIVNNSSHHHNNLNTDINRNTIINIKNNRNSSNIRNINISKNKNNSNDSVKIKHILYNKAKIKKFSDTTYNKNLSCRYKTIRYVKKSKNKIERIEDNKKKDNFNVNTNANTNKNTIMKIEEMQFKGISKKNSEKSINYLDKTEPTNFTINSPFNQQTQNSFIKYRTLLSTDINETPNIIINLNDYKKEKDKEKETIINLSQLNTSNNGEEQEDNFSTKKYNTSTSKLRYNFSYEKIVNTNITGMDDISGENKLKQILNLLSFEDLLLIEDKFNLILIVLEKGNKTYEESFDLWNYFFSSGLRTKLEQVFKYFSKEIETMKSFINYSLIFIVICYDFAANSISLDIDNNFSLVEIAQMIYTNILIAINIIKNKISLDNEDNYNIRLIELSKIEITIKNKLSNIDNDFLFIKEILINNSNQIIKKITSIIESDVISNLSNNKYNSEIFTRINSLDFETINQYFLDNILKEDFLGCSVLASTYIKEKKNFTPVLAPYINVENRKKYTLIVDLDETLIHFAVNNKVNEEGVLKLRPGVFTFFEKVGEFYEIILFTEASEAYTKLMMEAFSNNRNNKKYFDYILYRQHCVIVDKDFVKDISRVGRPLDRTIIIDNMAQNFKMQKKNAILIKPFLGEDQNDQALIDLIPILVNIARDEIDVKNGLTKYRDEILTKISSNLFRRNKHK